MSEDEKQLSNQSVDNVVTAVKGAIGAIPIAGPLIAEVAGTMIPNQRIDRIANFAEALGRRLDGIEEQTLKTQLTNENFTDAIEESLWQAARSTSDERREYIASILANGVESDNIDFIETKHLLRLLGEINDIEVVWLRAYSSEHHSDQDFRKTHSGTLTSIRVTRHSTHEEVDKAAMQESYKLHLESLGLLRSTVETHHQIRMPVFDKKYGFIKKGYEITPIGKLLIRFVDMVPVFDNE